MVGAIHNDQQVLSFGKLCLDAPVNYPDRSLDLISLDSASNGPPSDTKAEPIHGKAVRKRCDSQMRPPSPRALPKEGQEPLGEMEAFVRSKGSAFYGGGMSCQRAFRRRRAKTRRPVLLRMRFRNPWTRFRLRREIVRRCFFMNVLCAIILGSSLLKQDKIACLPRRILSAIFARRRQAKTSLEVLVTPWYNSVFLRTGLLGPGRLVKYSGS